MCISRREKIKNKLISLCITTDNQYVMSVETLKGTKVVSFAGLFLSSKEMEMIVNMYLDYKKYMAENFRGTDND